MDVDRGLVPSDFTFLHYFFLIIFSSLALFNFLFSSAYRYCIY